MTKEDIYRMAREAGFEVHSDDVWITDGFWVKELERFAKLVAAAEREACAKVCIDIRDATSNQAKGRTIASHCAIAIRERGAP